MKHSIPLAALLLAACQGAPLEPHGDDGGGAIGSGTLRASSGLMGSGHRTGEDSDESPAMGGSSGEHEGGGTIGSGTLGAGSILIGSGNRSGDEEEAEDSPIPGGSNRSTLAGSGYDTGGEPPVAEGEAAGEGNPMMGGGSG